VKVDGTPYQVRKLSTGWWVCTDSLAVVGPYRTRGEALSAAIARHDYSVKVPA